MDDNRELTLFQQHREGQKKHTYFLLAAAASAIAFAVHKTTGSTFSIFQIPLGAAVFLWGLSFYLGCKSVDNIQSATLYNRSMLHLINVSHPKQPASLQETEHAIQLTRENLENLAQTAGACITWQFRCLIGGGVCFILWHLLEMYSLSIANSP